MVSLKSRESLAVKYRPKRLEQLVGQDDIVSLLKGQFKSPVGINRSFLLSGPSGTGKTSISRILAHYINCENFNTKECTPCGTCSYCLDVAKGFYGGVDEINFSDTRGIDTVRAVIDSTAYASQFNAHVFICDEVQCLTNVAQNALLKILEEPPEGVMFLLLTTDPHKLLPTIINRCCPLTVAKVDVDTLAKYLLKVSKLEKRDYFTPVKLPSDQELAKAEVEKSYAIFKNIAMFSNGLVRQALATLEAVLCMVEGGQHIDTQDTETIRRIVGQFVESPDTELDIAKYLIQGIYSGRYGLSLSLALGMVENAKVSLKTLMDKTLDMHLQVLYFMVDPYRKISNLTDPFYNSIYVSVLEALQKSNFQLTHLAAAEIVPVFMQLLADLGSYTQDEKKLVVTSTLNALEIVNKYKILAYTQGSIFHKIHAPSLLVDK